MAAATATAASTDASTKIVVVEEESSRDQHVSSSSSSLARSAHSPVLSGSSVARNTSPQTSPSAPQKKVSSATLTPYDFNFISILGEGSFSTVYYGREVKTHRECAIKVCNKQHIVKEKKTAYIHREKDVLRMIANDYHPFFVRVYATFHDQTRLYFVTSLAKNGELLDYLKKLGSFDDKVTRFYAAELVVALEHLHRLGVIHRDLKPENILLSEDMHIKISDFGSAKIIGTDDSMDNRPTPLLPPPAEKKRSSFVGTAQYLSPEVLNGKSVGPSCDFWALGCIIYQMLSGLPPFRAANEYLMFQKINKLEYSFPDGFPDVPRSLVRGLLLLDPSRRIGAEERGGVQELKEHPFFEAVNWKNLPEQTPPDLLPYLPATGDQPEFHSTYRAQENLEPGLDDRQLTRLLGLQLADTRPSLNHEPEHILDITQKQREMRLKEQREKNRYHRFVEKYLVLKNGLVDKRKGLFARRRMLLLTEGPHLYYVDPAHMELKGQIPWSMQLRPEAKNFKTFFVHTPNRTYYLEDPSGHAPDWCDAIEQVRQFYYCKSAQQQQDRSSLNELLFGSIP